MGHVATDLRYFDLIVPCGIAERKATSVEKILSRGVKRNEAAPKLVEHFGEVFGLEMKEASRDELFEALEKFERQPVAVPA
jgi:lipoate-protein ligase B